MEQYIAVRVYELDSEEKITIHVFKPFLDEEDYRCDFEIIGFLNNIKSYAMGSDSIQALFLALSRIAIILYTSEEYKHGRLTLYGSLNLDLPYPDTIADLVKK
ncbi:DUF6968 family protein [Acinetobacter defluvii]|uniref:DUF6968 family protein n=1 Tax=Acinetobacter defluvii TaxID=1871111 RepID=UPI003AF84D30